LKTRIVPLREPIRAPVMAMSCVEPASVECIFSGSVPGVDAAAWRVGLPTTAGARVVDFGDAVREDLAAVDARFLEAAEARLRVCRARPEVVLATPGGDAEALCSDVLGACEPTPPKANAATADTSVSSAAAANASGIATARDGEDARLFLNVGRFLVAARWLVNCAPRGRSSEGRSPALAYANDTFVSRLPLENDESRLPARPHPNKTGQMPLGYLTCE
jgi:hypothetical protein